MVERWGRSTGKDENRSDHAPLEKIRKAQERQKEATRARENQKALERVREREKVESERVQRRNRVSKNRGFSL